MDADKRLLTLDWLGFTFIPIMNDVDPLIQFFHEFPEFEKLYKGNLLQPCKIKSHYNKVLSLDNDIFICYNLIDDHKELDEKQIFLFNMGVNVQIPSHALNSFCKLLGYDSYSDDVVVYLFEDLISRNCKLSRIDLAFDDFSKTYTGRHYRMFWSQDRIQSPFIRNITCMGDLNHGFTLYVGSLKKRDKLLRIYDKWLESDGEIDSVRYEFELHADKAVAVSHMIIDEYRDGIPFAEFLYGWLKIKSSSAFEYNRIQDAPDDEEWIKFVAKDKFNEELKPIKVRVPHPDKPEDINLYYFDKSVLPTIDGFVQCFGWKALYTSCKRVRKEGKTNKNYLKFLNKLRRSEEFATPVTDDALNPLYYDTGIES